MRNITNTWCLNKHVFGLGAVHYVYKQLWHVALSDEHRKNPQVISTGIDESMAIMHAKIYFDGFIIYI